MDFEIDVSGSDIFEKDYTILVAERGNSKILLAYKFSDKNALTIRSRHGEGKYRYPYSKAGKSNIKVRLYCVAIYFLFKELKKRFKLKDVTLAVCRDFSGNESKIKQNLEFLLGTKLGLNVSIAFQKLPKNSIADKYAFLIRHDTLNKFSSCCIKIKVEEFEEFLK
ncbi:MAG: hypothetical protein V1494_07380 [Candidatus Diapherotrites archaeon]